MPAKLPANLTNAKAFVFDAYGTLFDVHSAVAPHATRLGTQAASVSQLWRSKQLEYSWLRSLMSSFVPFWQITNDALDFALEAHGINDAKLRDDLAAAYLKLSCYPEVPAALTHLRSLGRKTALLTNGSKDMVDAAVSNAALEPVLNACFSVDQTEIYKPHASVYQMACDGLMCTPAEIAFFSSNAWDVAGAAHFGFQVAWVNRFGQAAERLPGKPVAVLPNLRSLAELQAPV